LSAWAGRQPALCGRATIGNVIAESVRAYELLRSRYSERDDACRLSDDRLRADLGLARGLIELDDHTVACARGGVIGGWIAMELRRRTSREARD
jgi:hypothetical protein